MDVTEMSREYDGTAPWDDARPDEDDLEDYALDEVLQDEAEWEETHIPDWFLR